MTRYVLISLILTLLLPVSASASMSIDRLFPDEEEMGYESNVDFDYRKDPIEYHNWDTVHKWLEMKGIRPVMGDADELTAKSIYTPWQNINNMLSRTAITFLQMGFRTPVFDAALDGLSEKVKPIRDYVYENLLGISTLILACVVIAKYWQGRIGESIVVILKAGLYSALLFVFIEHLGFFLKQLMGFTDYISLAILGAMHMSMADVTNQASERIIEVSNVIYHFYIYEPWLFGQFGTTEPIPTVTVNERSILGDNLIQAEVGQPWDEVFLSHAPGSGERGVMMEALLDEDVIHSPDQPIIHMFESGGALRMLTALLTSLLAITGFLFYGAIGAILFASKLGVVITCVLLAFLFIFSFAGKAGERVIMRVLGILISLLAVVIAVSFYIGIPMLTINLLGVQNLEFFWSFVILMIVNLLGLFLLPMVFKTVVPAIIRGVAQVTNSVGRAKDRVTGRGSKSNGMSRTMPPRIPAERLRKLNQHRFKAQREEGNEMMKMRRELQKQSDNQRRRSEQQHQDLRSIERKLGDVESKVGDSSQPEVSSPHRRSS